VAADILTDFPELFAERQKLFLQMASGPPRAAILESHWLHKGRIVFKFAGIDSIEDAETLAGAFVQIPLAERAQVPQGAYYVRDLVGCRLFDREEEIGTVSDVAFGAGTAPLLKVTAGEQNFEIPFADAYVKHLDLAAREIRTELPQGLLEINRRPETAKKKPEPKPEAKPGKP
jgi:16S rRNA processing protein RimM